MSEQRGVEADPITGDVRTTYTVPSTTAPERIEAKRGRPFIGDRPVKGDKTTVPCDDGTAKGFPGCPAMVTREYLATHRRKQHNTRQRQPTKGKAPLQGADVVTTVLEATFPKGIPARHLDLVIEWREQTIAFMKAVQQ